MMLLPVENNKTIYVRKSALRDAYCGSSAGTHVCRRLLRGVFKDKAFMECTLRGQTTKKASRQKFKNKPLHSVAIKAIKGNFIY